jgi:hypothetical protein
MNTIQNDVSLWEVWIEYDPFHPKYFGTLYVHGEALTDKKSNGSFIRIESGEGHQLTLQLPVRSQSHNSTKEVLYSEPISNLNQYTSVCIYEGKELIGCFNDIEVMI